MNRIAVIFCLMLFSLCASAQRSGPAMADTMREDGKIFVVIGVIVIIFVSIIAFLIFIERKLAKLERSVTGKDTKEDK